MAEDERIIALLFERSEQAIRELDGKYGSLCRSLSYHILGSRQDAEECVSDAWLGVWNAIPPARPESLRVFVVKIVRNLSLKAYNRREADKRSSAHTVALREMEHCLASASTPETEVEARELAGIIERFLDTLTVRERVIFMRRYGYADSYADIAKRMGISEKNVSVRLSLIRRRLRQYLQQEGIL